MKYRTYVYAYCILLIVCIESCTGIKTKLNAEDLKWLPYKVNDTLIFTSSNSTFDTVTITDRNIYYSDYKPNGVATKYTAQIGEVSYKSSRLHEGILMKIIKQSPEELEREFTYGNSLFLFGRYYSDSISKIPQIITILGKKYNDVYVIMSNNKDIRVQFSQMDIRPRTLYWSMEYGLVKYITFSNEEWVLAN